MKSYGTIWVCVCCVLTHANGECCADDQHGGDGIVPLSSIGDGFHVASGMARDEHEDECLHRTMGDDAPSDYECDCGTCTFSTSQCEGCGSWLHGERHAVTLFKSAPRPVPLPVMDDTPTLLRKLYDV